MALEVEGVVDGGVAEESLCGARRLERLHFALASSHRLMRVLRPIVLSESLTQKICGVTPDGMICRLPGSWRGQTPMWTEEHRRTYRREGAGYPSDLRDAEWARLAPLIPEALPGGRPRKTDMRAAINAILYLLRTGCPWRYLPRDSFPPRSTVYNIFCKFQREGVWDAIWAELHMVLRERTGREASPSAAVLDSQSVKSAEKGAVKTTKWVTTPARR